MIIVGISAYYHDSACCLLKDGEVIAAAQEERFTRVKFDERFPENALNYCLGFLENGASDVDYVAFYDNWSLKKERVLDNLFQGKGQLVFELFSRNNLWAKERDFLRAVRQAFHWDDGEAKQRIFCVDHHMSHAASAYFCSPFDDATVITVDGVGEYSTTTIGRGKGGGLELLYSINFPNSLGLVYSAFTSYCGFKVNSGEYKLMGLAPYGRPTHKTKILDHMIRIGADGSFSVNQAFFNFRRRGKMYRREKFLELFGIDENLSEETFPQDYADLAASIQEAIYEALRTIMIKAIGATGQRKLVMAGGVALNCSAIGKARLEPVFDDVFVQPAAGDAGGAMGAAMALNAELDQGETAKPRNRFNARLGPNMDSGEAEQYCIDRAAPYRKVARQELAKLVAEELVKGKTVAWARGRGEWGPRALGGRSILANPLVPDIKKTLNLKIKKREGFRPFAPMMLERHMDDAFLAPATSNYMSFVFFLKDELRARDAQLQCGEKVLSAEDFGRLKDAVIHEDHSARLQTVSEDDSEIYDVLNGFFEKTGCPMMVNTSFNTRGEPIVNGPADAYRCFMQSEIDVLVMSDLVLYRSDQSPLAAHEIAVFDKD